MNWKRKQANWQIDEHMSNYHERRVQQSLGEEKKRKNLPNAGCHTCIVSEWKKTAQKKMTA